MTDFLIKILTPILFLTFTFNLYSQIPNAIDTIIYSQEQLTVKPEPKNGYVELFQYITNNVNFEIKDNSWCGYGAKVFIEFVVEKDSALTNFSIIRGNCPTYDNQILETLKKMPKWSPGEIDGVIVRSRFLMPVHMDFQ